MMPPAKGRTRLARALIQTCGALVIATWLLCIVVFIIYALVHGVAIGG